MARSLHGSASAKRPEDVQEISHHQPLIGTPSRDGHIWNAHRLQSVLIIRKAGRGPGEQRMVHTAECADANAHRAAGRGQPAAEGGHLEPVREQDPDFSERLISEKPAHPGDAALRFSCSSG